jgi:hypothetical protein
MKIKLLILSSLVLFFNDVYSQELSDTITHQPINKKMLTTAIVTESVVYFAGMSYLQFVWYKDCERVPFEFYNDNKAYLQMDKFGHSFAAYGESYLAYQWLRKAGVSKNKALLYGAPLGFVMQAPIEIFDGIYEGWGFSWGDIVANASGCVLLAGQELLFDEQIFRYKLGYARSQIARETYGLLGNNAWESFFYDYNSQSYWLSFNANKLFLKDVLPSWINIAVGYSTDGVLGYYDNKTYYHGHELKQYERTRQYLLSLDIDWEKIPTNSKFLKGLFVGLNFIKIPFPALEYNSQGKFVWHWMYPFTD